MFNAHKTVNQIEILQVVKYLHSSMIPKGLFAKIGIEPKAHGEEEGVIPHCRQQETDDDKKLSKPLNYQQRREKICFGYCSKRYYHILITVRSSKVGPSFSQP